MPTKCPRRLAVPLATVFLAFALVAGSGCDRGSGAPPSSGHERMLELLQRVRAEALLEHPYFGTRRLDEARAELAALPESGSEAARWRLLLDCGLIELRRGREREGIALLEEAYRLLPGVRREIGPDAANNLVLLLGVAYLRVAETENCCAMDAPEACIIPFADEALHTKPEGSTRAIRYLEEVLARPNSNDIQRLSAIWLLNLAHMTLGRYPAGVPEAYRLPPGGFVSGIPFPRFRNVAREAGLGNFSLSGGAIVDDFDGDDRLDVVTSTWDVSGQMRFYRNEGDGTFADRTAAAGLTGLVSGLNLVPADYDNDGRLDILVLRGAWGGELGRHPNSLLRNDGGTFTDVTFEAGLGEVHWPTQTAGWSDYDHDGDLDLYVGNETTRRLAAPCQLFRNEGDGTFTDVAATAGVLNDRCAKGVAWGDFDGDRWPDLYVSNLGQPNRLYRNRGDGTFTDVADEAGVTEPRVGFPTWAWDFDNDGALDIFAASYTGHVWEQAAYRLGLQIGAEPDRLYRGDGRGGFEEVGASLGLGQPTLPMGSNFGDLDNDGWLDFYLGTGDPDYVSVVPNLMFLNRGGRGFVDVTMAGGFGHLQKGHGVAFADVDGDGDLDVFEEMGGAYPGDGFRDALWENPGFGNHWLVVHLVGAGSNRSAIGARIRADLFENGATRSIHRWVGSGGSFGANPLRQTIGLGAAEEAGTLEIFWPTTETTQVFRDVPADQAIRIVEGEDRWTRIAR